MRGTTHAAKRADDGANTGETSATAGFTPPNHRTLGPRTPQVSHERVLTISRLQSLLAAAAPSPMRSLSEDERAAETIPPGYPYPRPGREMPDAAPGHVASLVTGPGRPGRGAHSAASGSGTNRPTRCAVGREYGACPPANAYCHGIHRKAA